MSRATSLAPLALAVAVLGLGERVLGQAGAPPPPAPPAWPAPPTADAPPPGGPEYVMDVTLRADHRTIDGALTVRWTNTSTREARELWWHLYMNAFAGDDTLFMRTGGAGGHRGHLPGEHGRVEVRALRIVDGPDLLAGSSADPDVPRDATQLRTPLPAPVAPGASLALRVEFTTVLPAAFARAGYWRDFAFAGQWFPKLAVLREDGTWAHFPFHAHTEFFADFGSYDVTLRVPAGDVVGATGDDVASVAEQQRGAHRFTASRVHDFAWTAWRGFRERRDVIAGVAVRTLYGPGMDGVAARNLDGLRAAMPLFAQRFGPYPYPRLTVVVPPPQAEGVEGMEYPTLITTGGAWTLPRSVHDAEYVAAHEFAHQYFYGLLASDEWSWPFLDEGFAEYASGLCLEDLYGTGRELVDSRFARLGFWAYQGGFAGMLAPSLPVAGAANSFPSYSSYGGHVYRRAASVLRTAERSFGAEGVRRALQLYTARFRFRHPTPDDLLASFRDAMGPGPVDGFLRPALFGDAALDYRVVAIARGADRAGLRTGYLDVARDGALALPVDVEFVAEDGAHSRARWDGRARTARIVYEGASPLRAAWLDPDERIPLDRDRSNNARAVAGREGSSLPLTARLAFALNALLRAVGP